MTLLVIGASGYVGRHVARRARALGVDVVGTYAREPLDIRGVTWRRLDIRDAGAIQALVDEAAPAAVVSAAYGHPPYGTATASAAVNWGVNAHGAVHVAQAAAASGLRLVHVSSDAVHRGDPDPLTEDALPDPIYPYGAAKAAAELGIALVAPDAVIARVSLVHSSDGGDLSERERFILDLAAGRVEGTLFTDNVRCPIGVGDLAAALVELALGPAGDGSEAAVAYSGVLNLAGPDPINFYDLGMGVARQHGVDPSAIPSGLGGPNRPACLVLDTSRARSLLTTGIRGIHELLGSARGE